MLRKRNPATDARKQIWTTLTENRANKDYELLTYGIAKSTLGTILVATGDKGVVAVLLGENPTAVTEDLRTRFPKAHVTRDDQMHRAQTSRLTDYIESAREDVDFDLDLRGTEFQKKVDEYRLCLDYGQA
jgi:AraC family transcriptional regulator of adaptative response/methylated-DNA-[protein]-cysteine methyltransferase